MGFISRLFLGTGMLPAPLRGELESEGLLLLEEGRRGSITYRHYRAPGRRSNHRLVGLAGSIAVTRRRLVVTARRGPVIDCDWHVPQMAALDLSVDGERVCIAFDAGVFHADQSGRVEVRLGSVQPERIVGLVSELRAAATR